jgi:hypothetical protein
MWGTTALAILEACQNLALTVHVAIQFEDPDSSEVCKPSTGGRDAMPRVSIYGVQYDTSFAASFQVPSSNRWGNRIEIIQIDMSFYVTAGFTSRCAIVPCELTQSCDELHVPRSMVSRNGFCAASHCVYPM